MKTKLAVWLAAGLLAWLVLRRKFVGTVEFGPLQHGPYNPEPLSPYGGDAYLRNAPTGLTAAEEWEAINRYRS